MINDKVYFVFRNVKFYTCCDEPYLDITFNITMRRYVFFYRHHYFILIITVDPFYVHVRTQYSVDPGQPPPLSCTSSEPISNIFTFLESL